MIANVINLLIEKAIYFFFRYQTDSDFSSSLQAILTNHPTINRKGDD